ncbi:glycosyltransferase [Alkalihalobacillus sp. LMS39]|uniref:glycosyltransferase n=1 Tax=Alkalihalobacillus sp. LMS39 TaxID=2924032 RepID=UPI001FB4B7CC|nr:glycosyltransferase [Alkalihalobacillus sp. LMS39]UOE93872.1 glycosyltransferase [Alkalihalobacillus sp. LMS39]
MNPQITVLMSVFNDEQFLAQSIESILQQSYTNFDFLIFDDASNDGSKKILEHYAELDKRIKLIINKENKGLSYNLAEGVKLAKSPWIARMDADDIAVKNRLEIQMNYIKSNPTVDILGSYVNDIDALGEIIELRKVPTTHDRISNLIWTCPFIHPSVIFRKESIIKAGNYNKKLRRRQDYDLWFRCLDSNLVFANIDMPLLYYRATDNYYKKNNIKVQFQQAIMGVKGAKKVKAAPIAYLGIFVAFVKGILPIKIRKVVNRLLKKYDPRRL